MTATAMLAPVVGGVAAVAAPSPIVLTVNPSQPPSSSNFLTIQSAINSVPASNIQPYTVNISPGVYDERVLVPVGKEYINLIGGGASRNDVVLTAHDWMGGVNGWEGSQPLRAYANNFRLENVTLRNTWGDNGQATALRTKGDKQVFQNVVLDGWQDTFLAEGGRQYFHNSEIRGRVDFIYGPARLVIDDSDIVSRNGGYVTAASTPASSQYGFVFLNSRLKNDPAYAGDLTDDRAYLGRPWGAPPGGGSTAAVAYINTYMEGHIRPAGWDNWGNPINETTARYSEYNSTGPGANSSARVSWSRQLTAAEAAAYTTPNVFDGWDPLNTPMVPVSWTGGAGDGKWSSASNWDSGAAPMAGQNLYVQPSVTSAITVDGSAVGDQLAIGKSGTPSTLNVTTTGNLNIKGGLFLNGGSTVNVDGGTLTAPTVTADAANTNNVINVKNNGQLNIGNWTGPWGPSGMLVVNKGTFAAKGMDGAQIRLAPNSGDIATLNIRPGDSWTKTRHIETGDGTSVINQTGGTVAGTYGPYFGNVGSGGGNATYNLSGGSANWLDPTLGRARRGTFNVNQTGGTINRVGNTESFNDGIIQIGNVSAANATWNLSGTGAINHRGMAVGNAGSGTFVQSGGSVVLNQPIAGSTKGSGLKVGYGSGTGLYQISGGSLTVQNGGLALGYKIDGTVATGSGEFEVLGGFSIVNITGDYLHNANSTLAAELNASGLSTIAVTGNVNFAPGALLDLQAGPGATNGTYTLMTWSGLVTGTPNLASGVDTSAWSYSVNPVARTLSVTYVPEPSFATAAPVAAWLLSLRRRRRSGG